MCIRDSAAPVHGLFLIDDALGALLGCGDLPEAAGKDKIDQFKCSKDVYKRQYLIISVGYLILRPVSRLDAFSVYPIRT